MESKTPPVLEDVHVDLGEDLDGAYIKRTQDIPDSYLRGLRLEREASLSTPAGEFHRVASIPVAVVEKWLREGFDIHREPIQAVLTRLDREGLDAFKTTNKRV
jgi:hypothetical protein